MMIDVTAGPTRQRPGAIVTLLRAYLLMSLLLLAQFVLGMAVNLFVTIPAHHPGAHPSNYFAGSAQSIGWAIPRGGVWLAAHVSLGLALVLGGIVTITLATRSGNRVDITGHALDTPHDDDLRHRITTILNHAVTVG